MTRRLGPVTTCPTERPGHAIELARKLIEQGYERIIAAGGDGTINEVANGLLTQQETESALGILPLGTGGDFRRSLGVPNDVEGALDVLTEGRPVRIDAGRATYTTVTGATETRFFVNLVSFGMGGQVAARAQNLFRIFGGGAAFLYATLETFFRYKARRVAIELDGACATEHRITNIAIGNGRYHGGGMHPCPQALLNDGVLEVTVIDRLGMLEMIRDLPVLYSDNIYKHPKAHHFRARRLR